MSRYFNFRRFGLLFKKHLAEQYKAYFMSFVVLTGVLTLGLGFLAFVQSGPINNDMQILLYTLPMFLTGAIFTSNAFAALGDKKRAITYLTLPASHLEKYLVGWISTFVIFIVLYTISFYIVLYGVLSVDDVQEHEVQLMNIFSGNTFLNLLGAYAGIHAIAILGSVYFEKGHFIKTAFIFFLSLALLTYLNEQVMQLVLGIDISTAPFRSITIMDGEMKYYVTAPDVFGEWIDTIIPFLVVCIFWVASYVRLKEKEV